MCAFSPNSALYNFAPFEPYENEIPLYFSTQHHISNMYPGGCFVVVHMFSLMYSFPSCE